MTYLWLGRPGVLVHRFRVGDAGVPLRALCGALPDKRDRDNKADGTQRCGLCRWEMSTDEVRRRVA